MQKFRQQWLQNDKFKNWLQMVEGVDSKGRCKYYKCFIGVRFNDIKRHVDTSKHRNAAAPFNSKRAKKKYPKLCKDKQ
jgi:hypothetical protein